MAITGSFTGVAKAGLYLSVVWSAEYNSSGCVVTLTPTLHYPYAISKRSQTNNKAYLATNGDGNKEATYTSQAIESSKGGSATFSSVSFSGINSSSIVKPKVEWAFNGTYSGTYVGTLSAEAPNNIDIAKPTPTVTYSEITANSAKLSVTSNYDCEKYEYSLNGSTWVTFGTSGTSASVTISGLTPNTSYTPYIRITRKNLKAQSTSHTKTLKTLGGATIISVEDCYIDEQTPSVNMLVDVYNPTYIYKLSIAIDGSVVASDISVSFDGTGQKRINVPLSAYKTALLTAMPNKTAVATYTLTAVDISASAPADGALLTTAENSAPDTSGAQILATYRYGDDTQGIIGAMSNAITNGIIRNHTLITVGVFGGADVQIGAHIAGYYLKIGNNEPISDSTYIISTDTPITDSGDSIEVIFGSVDTRGYSSEITLVCPLIDYQPLFFNENSLLERQNLYDNAIDCSIGVTLSPLKVQNVAKNLLMELKYRYSVNGGTPTAWVDITPEDVTDDYTFTATPLVSISKSSEVEFEFSATDKVSTTIFKTVVPKGVPLVEFRDGYVNVNGDYYTNGTKGLLVPDTDGVTDGYVPIKQSDGSILWQAQSGGGGGGNIPKTTNLLKGDGSGNALAASPNIDYSTPSNVDGKISAHNSNTAAHLDIRGELANKQDTISDLEDIRDGAALGATALQSVPSTYRTAAAQDTIDNGKVDKESGKGLSTNDYTTTEKNKLAGIEAGAEVNDVEDIVAGTNVTVTKTGKVYTISASGGGGGGSIPATTNLLMGDGSGNAADSEITADEVIDALDNKIPLISNKAEIVILGYYGAAATVAQINAAYPASAHPGAYAYSSLMRKLFKSVMNSWTEVAPSTHNVYIYGTDERWFRWDGYYMREANYALADHAHAALDALVALGLPTPTIADKGKVLGIDDSGHYALISATPPTPTTDCTISVNVVGLANDTVLYVEYNGTKYYTNGSQFTVPNGASLYCYAFFSASNNWVKLNGTTVASGSPAEYTLTVTGNVAVTLDGSPGDRGHITLTM